jgi:hypothetical protein
MHMRKYRGVIEQEPSQCPGMVAVLVQSEIACVIQLRACCFLILLLKK